MKPFLKYLFAILLCLTQAYAMQAWSNENDIIQSTSLEHQIHCPAGDCPEGIGTMVTLGMMGREFCRVFLIDEKTAITNAHCLYAIIDEGITENKSCLGEASIKFGNGESANCKELKFSKFTESDISSSDVAIIELEKPVRTKPVSLKRTAFSDEQDLYFYKSSFSFETNSSEMKRVDCKTKMFSSAAGSFFTNKPVTISMSDCPFDYGDSGSPIFDKDGNVVAVLQGGLPQEALDAFKKITLPAFDNLSYSEVLKQYSLEKFTDFKPVIAATTMTCLERNEIPGEMDCKPLTLKEHMTGLLENAYLKELDALANIEKENPDMRISLSQDTYKNMLRDVKVNEMKPEDLLTPINLEVDCSRVEKPVNLLTQKIRSSNDAYFRINLVLEYEMREFCRK